MTEVLAKLLKELKPTEVKSAMYLLQGRIMPKFIPLEFNFSTKLLARNLSSGFNVDLDEVNKKLAKLGDIGLVAESIVEGRKTKVEGNITITEVYEALLELAQLEGTGSQEAKGQMFIGLAKGLDPVSLRYVARIITGKMRLGLSDKTVLDALSWSIAGDKSLRKQVERAYGVRSDLGVISELVLTRGVKALDRLKLEVGTPLASKLVEREGSVEATFKRLGVCFVQAKYDGLRTQIHYSDKGFKDKPRNLPTNLGFEFEEKQDEKVRIFSRNMEPLTAMFPDIAEAVSKLGVKSVVLDAEAIGYDSKTGKFFPFQETIQRKRKYGVGKKVSQIPIKVFVFDILTLNGKDLTQEKLESRIAVLKKLLSDKLAKKQSVLVFSESVLIKDEKTMEKIFRRDLKLGLEGIIAKDRDSTYDPGTRNYDWIKLKANIHDELVDTIDCVVLGYYHGRGARAKFGAGAFLVGVYNKKKDQFESIAKVGTGIKDEDWEGYVDQIKKIQINKLADNVVISKELMPDVLCRPEIVVVVAADEITKSKGHTAGRGKDGRGFSLRFPRLKEWGRVDKKPEQVTSVEEIKKLYKLRK